MKSKFHFFLLFLLCLGINKASAQQICFYFKGAWSNWTSPYVASFYNESSVHRYTNLSGCCLKTEPGGIVFFDFYMTNFTLPSKKEIKKHQKNDEWYTYYGTVEYYVNDEYPTAEELAKNNRLVWPNPRTDITPNVKRKTSATIRIAPFKKEPEVFNIWFDNIAVGFSIKGLNFKK